MIINHIETVKYFLIKKRLIDINYFSTCSEGSTTVTYTDDLKALIVGQEDGTILLFENDNSSPVVLTDFDITQTGEPCTDLKIKSSPKGGYNKTFLAGCKFY